MIRRLYDWLMRLAAGPNAVPAMAAVSFIESSFFPIPPDALLIPMVIAAPRRAWLIATVCTVASVLGGFLGYAIGYFLFDAVGRPVLEFYGAMAKYDSVKATFDHWGAWFIIIKGMTPIPYKIVTITSGLAGYPVIPFILLSIVSRGMRFYLVAFLIYRFGDRARKIIEERLELWATLAAILVVAGIIVAVYLF